MLSQTIKLADKEYTLKEPAFKKGQELRRVMQVELEQIFGALGDKEKTIDVTELVRLAVQKSDNVLTWLADYSVDIKKDVKYIEENAGLSELIDAVVVMVKQLFPFTNLLTVGAVSRNGSTTPPMSLN